jgi:hypothetical protein
MPLLVVWPGRAAAWQARANGAEPVLIAPDGREWSWSDAGLAQALRDEAVAPRPGADQRERAGRRLHRVRGRDVVLEEHGDAVKRAARDPRMAERVELLRLRLGVRVHEQVRVHARAVLVVRRDACEIHLHELLGGEEPGLHRVLQLRDRGLDELELRGAGAVLVRGEGRRDERGQQQEKDRESSHGWASRVGLSKIVVP